MENKFDKKGKVWWIRVAPIQMKSGLGFKSMHFQYLSYADILGIKQHLFHLGYLIFVFLSHFVYFPPFYGPLSSKWLHALFTKNAKNSIFKSKNAKNRKFWSWATFFQLFFYYTLDLFKKSHQNIFQTYCTLIWPEQKG